MAEPLGILASLIAVVQISSKVISICYAYRSGVKKAPRDLTRITSDVTSLRDIIEQLIRIVDEDSSSKNSRLHTIQTLNEPGGPLIRLQYELKTLEAKLKPASGWNAVGQALMWPLREGDVNNTLSFIERVKSTLSLSLLTDHTYVKTLCKEKSLGLCSILVPTSSVNTFVLQLLSRFRVIVLTVALRSLLDGFNVLALWET